MKYFITSVLVIIACWQLPAQDTIKVMYYNVLNYPGSTPERVDYFRTITQYVLPDVLLITEILDAEGAADLLDFGLNAGPINYYEKAMFSDGPDTDNMLYYNSNKLGLKAQQVIPTALRDINEYVLYHKGPDSGLTDTVFIRFFVAHLKASTGTVNEEKRLLEVMQLGQYLADNDIDQNYIFGGDLNFYDANEPAYQYILSPDGLDMWDPLPAGNWHDNIDFAAIHTQSTRTEQFGGGATGGCDDRFDFTFYAHNMLDAGQILNYVPGSSFTLANDGQHFNMGILDGPTNTTVPDSVLTALYYMADHLPVISSFVIQNQPSRVTVEATVLLEGAFNGIDMNPTVVAGLPHDQPFNQSPWFYEGQEFLSNINANNVVDWCLLELRVSNGSILEAIADTAVWKKACLILSDGSLVDTNTVDLPAFDNTFQGDLYLVVRHRNHLDIISANPLQIVNDKIMLDFTNTSTTVYGGTDGYSQLVNGRWGLTSGDMNGDGVVNPTDLLETWAIQTGQAGYLNADANLNKQVDNLDKNQYCIPNFYKFSVIQP